MQLAIELPDDLGQQISRFADVQQFVQDAVKKMLLEVRKEQALKQLRTSCASLPDEISFADELIAERRTQAKQEQREILQ